MDQEHDLLKKDYDQLKKDYNQLKKECEQLKVRDNDAMNMTMKQHERFMDEIEGHIDKADEYKVEASDYKEEVEEYEDELKKYKDKVDELENREAQFVCSTVIKEFERVVREDTPNSYNEDGSPVYKVDLSTVGDTSAKISTMCNDMIIKLIHSGCYASLLHDGYWWQMDKTLDGEGYKVNVVDISNIYLVAVWGNTSDEED